MAKIQSAGLESLLCVFVIFNNNDILEQFFFVCFLKKLKQK